MEHLHHVLYACVSCRINYRLDNGLSRFVATTTGRVGNYRPDDPRLKFMYNVTPKENMIKANNRIIKCLSACEVCDLGILMA